MPLYPLFKLERDLVSSHQVAKNVAEFATPALTHVLVSPLLNGVGAVLFEPDATTHTVGSDSVSKVVGYFQMFLFRIRQPVQNVAHGSLQVLLAYFVADHHKAAQSSSLQDFGVAWLYDGLEDLVDDLLACFQSEIEPAWTFSGSLDYARVWHRDRPGIRYAVMCY